MTDLEKFVNAPGRDKLVKDVRKKINELKIGKIHTLKVKVKKLNFPRIKNLPNRIVCEDETGLIDIVY